MKILDVIDGKEIKIENDTISYNKTIIHFKDVIDLYYSSSEVNGNVIIGLNISDKNKKRIDISYTNSSLIRLKNEREKVLEISLKFNSLYQKLYPVLFPLIIQNKLDLIKSGKDVKIWKLHFNKLGVSFNPKKYLWLIKVEVPYQFAIVTFNRRKIGFGGHNGSGNLFEIENIKTRKKYYNTTNLLFQPSSSEFEQINAIINYLKREKENNLKFDDYDKLI